MVTKDSAPSMQSRSATTPTGEESVTPVIQPSGLGELSASMVTETDRKLEVIQRAQVSSLMGSHKTKEPPEKTPKKQSPALAAQPKKYALETLIALILPLTLSTVPIQVVPACTWTWPAICWPSMERRLTLGQVSSTIKVL